MSWFIRWKALLLAAAFLALGGCLLLAGEGILSDAGVRRETADLPGGRGSLWTPVGIQTTAEISDDEDGHDHAVTVISGGAALVLTDAFDGSRSLAAELARRGVTTLLYGGSDPAELLKRMAGRVKVIHFKDYKLDENGEKHFVPLGQGVVNLKECYDVACELEIPFIMYEHDNDWPNDDPFLACELSWQYLCALDAE